VHRAYGEREAKLGADRKELGEIGAEIRKRIAVVEAEIAAEREAREETGLAPIGPGRPLIAFEPLPGFLTATVHVHVWEGAEGEVTEPTGEPRDPLEPGRVRWLPLAEVPGLAAEGRLLGSGTLVGLLQYLAERAGD
jgi:8-oxo-dGTP pyrophosphatase MutT (NUDIX family)